MHQVAQRQHATQQILDRGLLVVSRNQDREPSATAFALNRLQHEVINPEASKSINGREEYSHIPGRSRRRRWPMNSSAAHRFERQYFGRRKLSFYYRRRLGGRRGFPAIVHVLTSRCRRPDDILRSGRHRNLFF
jgi:hypothetical protein